eukprot:CAMPEP_0116073812 /NCGR_PEP_ID=MMETSP0322-20121206/15513_1 /TAXON_ID=163516 /ORGANISM="Leptocylindrus danicus var. apora, Strain B651" /LENGTH=665 /DNA_ID=CAMNT_0003563253 /DNA_START=98 /DNA_END=2096 /DNA_ORIENTATION=-
MDTLLASSIAESDSMLDVRLLGDAFAGPLRFDHAPYNVLARSNTSPENVMNRIVGGTETGGPLDYQALISFRTSSGTNDRYKCGGVLIDPVVVLTAAHCDAGVNGVYDIFLNAYDMDDLTDGSVEYRQVVEDLQHPDYYRDEMDAPNWDFRLLKLDSPVHTVSPILLDSGNITLEAGQKLVVSGWGTTIYQGQISDLLLQAELAYVEPSVCNDSFPFVNIDDVELCAHSDTSNACQGDSGGPLILQVNQTRILVGITSWGIGCDGSFPSIFARVSLADEWIKSIICDQWQPINSEMCSSNPTASEEVNVMPSNLPTMTIAPSVPCIDRLDFVDSFGDNCTYYENEDFKGCPLWGDCVECDIGFGTPRSSCCWCGGGDRLTQPPINDISSTPSSYMSSFPSKLTSSYESLSPTKFYSTSPSYMHSSSTKYTSELPSFVPPTPTKFPWQSVDSAVPSLKGAANYSLVPSMGIGFIAILYPLQIEVTKFTLSNSSKAMLEKSMLTFWQEKIIVDKTGLYVDYSHLLGSTTHASDTLSGEMDSTKVDLLFNVSAFTYHSVWTDNTLFEALNEAITNFTDDLMNIFSYIDSSLIDISSLRVYNNPSIEPTTSPVFSKSETLSSPVFIPSKNPASEAEATIGKEESAGILKEFDVNRILYLTVIILAFVIL